MKKVTVYVAEDGTRFDTPEACLEYELQCIHIDTIMSKLPEVKNLSGEEYYTHNPAYVLEVRNEFLNFIRPYFSDVEFHIDSAIRQDHNFTFIGRILNEAKYPFNRAWYRFARIDMVTGREYNQPYYVHQLRQQRGDRDVHNI